MTFNATGRVPTGSASRYLQQLCKHWAHNLDVEFDEQRGRIIFPAEMRDMRFPAPGIVTLAAEVDGLAITIAASAAEQRDGLKGALERHIDRFAFREVPLAYAWDND